MKKKKKEGVQSFIIRDTEALKKNFLFIICFVFLFSLGILTLNNFNPTGFVVLNNENILLDEVRIIDEVFENFEITKRERTYVDLFVYGEREVDVFIKKGKCDIWTEENDILDFFERFSGGNYLLGDDSGSWAEREFYKSEEICIIVSNSDEPYDEGEVSVMAKEKRR